MIYTDTLTHHGIEGQKWGVRRYQNEDGTRTEAGKKRYRKDSRSRDAREAEDIKDKPVEEMSNEELRKLNERQRLEQEHKRLNPDALKKAAMITGSIVATMGTVIALKNSGSQIIKMGKDAYDLLKTVVHVDMSNIDLSIPARLIGKF